MYMYVHILVYAITCTEHIHIIQACTNIIIHSDTHTDTHIEMYNEGRIFSVHIKILIRHTDLKVYRQTLWAS